MGETAAGYVTPVDDESASDLEGDQEIDHELVRELIRSGGADY